MHYVKRIFAWLLYAGATLYSGGLLAFALLWSFAPEATWWIALSNVFAALFFLPVLLLILIAALIRSRWLITMAVAPALAFLLMFGSLFLPRPSPAPPAGRDLRVATFNQLYYGENQAQLLAALRQQHADIVAIQELNPTVAAALQRDFLADYPYQQLDPNDGPGGLGLISRYPLAAVQQLTSQPNALTFDLDGQAVTVVNVHVHFSGISAVRSERFFGLPYLRMYDLNGRLTQVEGLLDELAPIQGPLIVMGDFNTGDREPGYAAMGAQFRDLFRETTPGFGYTFPYQRRMGPLYIPVPLVRIDYIWARGPLTPLATSVHCVTGSDHCMIVADMRLATP